MKYLKGYNNKWPATYAAAFTKLTAAAPHENLNPYADRIPPKFHENLRIDKDEYTLISNQFEI
jgi:hypothetical protein